MNSLLLTDALFPSCFLGSVPSLPLLRRRIVPAPRPAVSQRTLRLGFAASGRPSAMARNGALMTNSMSVSDLCSFLRDLGSLLSISQISIYAVMINFRFSFRFYLVGILVVERCGDAFWTAFLETTICVL